MNNRDAINHLEYLKVDSHIAKAEALDLAIEALKSERPKGKWIFDSIGCYCSECKKHPDVTTDYCPFCGADMRGDV